MVEQLFPNADVRLYHWNDGTATIEIYTRGGTKISMTGKARLLLLPGNKRVFQEVLW